jgi:predicted ATP-binding protein involved in virulence
MQIITDEVFITSIEVKKVRNIENFTIPLNETERKHLIITGKNGSGKTSLLLEINSLILNYYIHPQHGFFAAEIPPDNPVFLNFKNTTTLEHVFRDGNYLLTFFEARRNIFDLNIPSGINKVNLKKTYDTKERVNQNFIQYIVNLKAERSFAKDDNDNEAVAEIDTWFELFENQLKDLFEASDLQLIFDRKNYNFYIQIDHNEPFTLAQLSDGYSAVLSIVSELILRMEATGNKAYDLQGVVLIDEIETHLHVALQKKIMPFLCAFFPNIQFIITTHSPFVISSLKNAVVCDLEKREVISEDLTGYSYQALVESYFDTDEYSQAIKEKLYRYKFLSEQAELTENEEDEYDDLEDYFDNLPKFRAAALAVEAEHIGLKKMMRKG